MTHRLSATLIVSAVLAHAGLAGAATPKAHAAHGGVDVAFGNTILSTYPDGRTARLWLHRDGDYNAKGRRGDPSSGHWSIKGDKLCLKQVKPFGAPFSFCTPTIQGGVGSTWTAKAVSGEPIQVKLVEGGGA